MTRTSPKKSCIEERWLSGVVGFSASKASSGHHSIFVAETASTFNEARLLEDGLRTVQRDESRPSLFDNDLDGTRATSARMDAWNTDREDRPGVLAGSLA